MAITIKDDEVFCVAHNNKMKKPNFYVSEKDSMYGELGRIPICKNCIWKMADEYEKKTNGDLKKCVFLLCRKLDVPFTNKIFNSVLSGYNGERTARSTFGNYMRQLNSIGNNKLGIGGGFEDGEITEYDSHFEIAKAKKEVEDAEVKEEVIETLTDHEQYIKDEIIEMLEYDPFEGHSIADQRFLYTDLMNYFGDEDVIEDRYLVSQLIQIVNNNNSIRKMDYIISKLSGDMESLIKNQGEIKSISSVKNGIVSNNDKIAKENGIAVNKRKDSNVKKSTLTATMEYLRGLGFKDAEVDYYDQKKAYGMQMAADISFKAISEQLQFDENDMKEIIDDQRELIRELEEKLLDVEEKNRQLYEEIADYKRKVEELSIND